MRQLNFTVRGHSYIVKSPTIKNLINVEDQKAALTNGRYGAMTKTGTWLALYTLDMVDMIANLNVFAPGLLKDSNVNSLQDLEATDAEELKKCYDEQFIPWLEEVHGLLKIVPVAPVEETVVPVDPIKDESN